VVDAVRNADSGDGAAENQQADVYRTGHVPPLSTCLLPRRPAVPAVPGKLV
jgi:hypothetical protein